MTMTMTIRALTSALLTLLLGTQLAACGGGGGATAEPVTANSSAPAAAAPIAAAPVATAGTVLQLLPDAAMTWRTAAASSLTLTLHQPDGSPAAGAAVRVFTLSRTSPQDGSTLASPVPVALLESAASGADGRLVLPLRLPARLDELLVVVTLGDAQAQAAVAVDIAGIQREMTLAR
jgi:hypothetical protein